MARKKKFALEMNGIDVHELNELRRAFDAEAALEYFHSGRLLEWLSDRYYDREASAIRELDADDPNAMQKLCAALGVDYELHFDEEFRARVEEKRSILSSKTDDESIVDNARITALNQEDLADLLDLDEPLIFLCGEEFSIPLRIENKKYVGVLGEPKIDVDAQNQTELDARGIVFENCRLPFRADEEQNSSESPSNESGESIEMPSSAAVGVEVPRLESTFRISMFIHARQASFWAQMAGTFNSRITLEAKGKTIDVKSMLMIMSLGLRENDEVKLIAEGYDAIDAVKMLRAINNSHFNA